MADAKDFKALPPRELEILSALWQQTDPVSAMQLNTYMKKDWRIQTLITHLGRMVKKGVVKMERTPPKNGARYFYSFAIEQEEYRTLAIQEFLGQVCQGSATTLIRHLLASGTLKKQDLEALIG